MLASNHATANILSSYELMGLRIQKIVRSHSAQKTRCATVFKGANEHYEDWYQLLYEIGETDGVEVVITDTGSAIITWRSLNE